MRIISTLLPAILAGTATMLLSIPMVSANMKYLVSIRTRLDRLVNIDELSANQYTYIVNNISSNELLDAEMKDHSIHISVPRISDEIADYFCDWLDQEEINGDMTEDTADLIRNLFELGAAPSRPDDIPLSRINGPAQATYKNNGIVNFVARFNFSPLSGGIYNGIWGFTKGSREYALQCNSIGLNIVDVTTTPLVLIQTIPMPGGTIWRDVATNGDYAYVAAQGGSGPVAWVVNLSQLSGASAQGSNSDPITGSNIKNIGNEGWGHTMNVWNDLLFLNGAGGRTYGCRIFDLRPDPMSPELITTYEGGDCHDSYGQRIGQQDVLFSADGITTSHRILDISNIRTSTQIPKIGETNRVSRSYAHQNVVSDDGKTLFVFDEFNIFDIGVYDISDLSAPELIRTLQWSGEQSEGNSVVHNGLILGNYLVVAYYTAGLRVFDISNTSNIQEVGKYETFRDPNGDGIFDENSLSGTAGAWNVAKLSSGKILISDTVSGTFVVTLNGSPAPPTVLPSNSPTPQPVEPPTNQPITPPTVPPSNSPTQPVTPPTVSPSNSPTQPVEPPTKAPPCSEDKGTRFLWKIKKVGGIKVYKSKSCNWLNKSGKTSIKKICKQHKCDGDFGVPRHACPETCKFCTTCNQKLNSKFFVKTKKNTKVVKRSCTWLKRQSENKKNTLCSIEFSPSCYGVAKDVCPKVCSICE